MSKRETKEKFEKLVKLGIPIALIKTVLPECFKILPDGTVYDIRSDMTDAELRAWNKSVDKASKV